MMNESAASDILEPGNKIRTTVEVIDPQRIVVKGQEFKMVVDPNTAVLIGKILGILIPAVIALLALFGIDVSLLAGKG